MSTHTPESESGLLLQNRFPPVATSVFHRVESTDEPLNSSSNVDVALAGPCGAPKAADLAGAAVTTSNNSDSAPNSITRASGRPGSESSLASMTDLQSLPVSS
jgi:hypothetical protein